MAAYVARRVLMLIPVLLGVSLLVFSLVRIIPGDAVTAQLQEAANPVSVAQARKVLGLDKPFVEQYFTWLGGALHGDFGQSLWNYGASAGGEIRTRFPVTLELASLTIIVVVLIAIPGGIIAAVRQDRWIDQGIRFFSVLGLSIPNFWLATLLIVLPASYFHYFAPVAYQSFLTDPWTNLRQFTLPAVALGLHSSAVALRMTRSAMLDVVHQDYVRTARAKGLTSRVIIWRHALRNALIPVVTIIGNQLAILLGGTLVIEQIFSLPGLGRLTFDAIRHRDYPQIQADVLVLAGIVVLVNLAVDLSYAYLDPRIRYG
jgi:peptide/nickel transport system permease protein